MTGYTEGETQIYVGEAYTAKLQTMPIVLQGREGTSQMQDKWVGNVSFRLYRTLQIKTVYDTWTAASAESRTIPGGVWLTDDWELPLDGDIDTNVDIRVMSDEPLPMTILAISPEAVTP